jgi:putative PIG3 family NAD(P)H quinone oxidoreductase
MRAIVYRGAGGTEVIGEEERPEPTAGPDQVVVRVRAAGLNRADLIQRRGGYPAPPGWPADVPGLEYAGTIESLGPGVVGWRLGDRVMGLVGGGAHAERVVTHYRELIAIPNGLSDDEAAAIPEAFLTAYDALATRARVRSGERVLIHAVGSGVSTAAVQLAKWMGAAVIGTSRTAAKLERATALGLDRGIDTSQVGFAEQLGESVDVILDFFGGPALKDNLGALASRGRLIVLGTLQGAEASAVDVGRILRSRLEIIGTVMRARPHDERATLVAQFSARVLPELRAGGLLRAVVGEVFPMSDVAAAHRAMESNRTFGKLVLRWG